MKVESRISIDDLRDIDTAKIKLKLKALRFSRYYPATSVASLLPVCPDQ